MGLGGVALGFGFEERHSYENSAVYWRLSASWVGFLSDDL